MSGSHRKVSECWQWLKLPEGSKVPARFIEENTDSFSVKRICDVLDVSERGLRACRSRPAKDSEPIW